ncbi:hypothetical protein AB0H51_27755 [Streptomyces griseoluteus]|uniref:hypothetical protein n=1 Tax=Streptomyces griseoluteus TaxID=29306 RepID=UPI0033F239F2
MEWLTSLAPVLTPLFGMVGVLGGGLMVYRHNTHKTNTDAQTAEASTYVNAVTTVTDGFTKLLEQQRATNAQTLERLSTVETRIERLEEEQRQWRRWKSAAVEYIHRLRSLLTRVSDEPVPEPPADLAEDLVEH